jgi:hypothetical protein
VLVKSDKEEVVKEGEREEAGSREEKGRSVLVRSDKEEEVGREVGVGENGGMSM